MKYHSCFFNYSQRKITAYADVTFSNGSTNYKIEPVCRYFCGYDDCDQCQNTTFYEQNESLIKNLIFCRSCEKDPYMPEHCFHEPCSTRFHVGNKADHATVKIDLSKIEPENRRNFLLNSRYEDVHKDRWIVATVMFFCTLYYITFMLIV